MGCCAGTDVRNRMPEFQDLPDSTFCCMARMTYNMCRSAEMFYTGRDRVEWDSLTEEVRDKFATRAKCALRGLPAGEDHFNQLFYRLLRMLTATA